MEAAKPLAEMPVSARRKLIDFVVTALEDTAEEAEELGDALSAANSYNLATAIRGNATELATHDLKSAELLLQQGINLVAAGLARPDQRRLH